MQLSKTALQKLEALPGMAVPHLKLMELPERVLQFGTGVLLRALPDYFIDKANKLGVFNGRVVVVKSTEGDSTAFDRQDGLYTICVRGIENGRPVEENIINASISRVLNAKTAWGTILACAHDPLINIIISNTTEVGIQLIDDSVKNTPPVSYPGKLLVYLYERYKAFGGSAESGMVIIPTELISDNGKKLKEIVRELAIKDQLEDAFISWLDQHNTFCNSLVDRIVPGKPSKEEYEKLEQQLGYTDELLTMSEAFRLWAIEGDESVRERLSFIEADPGMVIAPDITLFKELKLRLLNGTHTYCCGPAFLSGFAITRDATLDKVFSVFMRRLMQEEISPSIPYSIGDELKTTYAAQVIERFSNPSINHPWLSITLQYSSKMRMRNVPLLLKHYESSNKVPMMMATGFAGFILFMRSLRMEGGSYYGNHRGVEYQIRDDRARYFHEAWEKYSSNDIATHILMDQDLWGSNLGLLPGFAAAVTGILLDMEKKGVFETITEMVNRN